MRKFRVIIWKVSRHGRSIHAIAEFSSEEKALERAAKSIIEVMRLGFIPCVRIA